MVARYSFYQCNSSTNWSSNSALRQLWADFSLELGGWAVEGQLEEVIVLLADLQEETEDLDWFAVDPTGRVAHFASGGRGFLPRSVKASKEDLVGITTLFRTERRTYANALISALLGNHVSFHDERERNTYLKDFCEMAEKGLYSFDCILATARPSGYFLVARPSTALIASDLPVEMKQIIEKTTLRIRLCEANEIGEADIVSV